MLTIILQHKEEKYWYQKKFSLNHPWPQRGPLLGFSIIDCLCQFLCREYECQIPRRISPVSELKFIKNSQNKKKKKSSNIIFCKEVQLKNKIIYIYAKKSLNFQKSPSDHQNDQFCKFSLKIYTEFKVERGMLLLYKLLFVNKSWLKNLVSNTEYRTLLWFKFKYHE